jgi:Abortive infection alpha
MSPDPEHEHENGQHGLDAVPGLARIAASAWWRTSGWAVRTSLSTARRAAVVATSPDKAIEFARELLGAPADNEPAAQRDSATPAAANGKPATLSLREEGEQLLRKSRDVHYEVEAHPAYERILSELAPDEGRILRLLLLDGPQPTVDVRTGGPIGLVRSRLIAPGLSMIGPRAGCRYVERVPSYLNNLFRLGLIWFSRETLRDPLRYQVLEAQPDVLEAIHSVRQAKVVRRSIHLTPFGEDFCRVALCGDGTPLDGLPPHSVPPETTTAPQPPTETVDG